MFGNFLWCYFVKLLVHSNPGPNYSNRLNISQNLSIISKCSERQGVGAVETSLCLSCKDDRNESLTSERSFPLYFLLDFFTFVHLIVLTFLSSGLYMYRNIIRVTQKNIVYYSVRTFLYFYMSVPNTIKAHAARGT